MLGSIVPVRRQLKDKEVASVMLKVFFQMNYRVPVPTELTLIQMTHSTVKAILSIED